VVLPPTGSKSKGDEHPTYTPLELLYFLPPSPYVPQKLHHRLSRLSTDHAVVHKVDARQFEFLVASVETVDGFVAVGRVGGKHKTGQLTTQVLRWSTARTCTQTVSLPANQRPAELRFNVPFKDTKLLISATLFPDTSSWLALVVRDRSKNQKDFCFYLSQPELKYVITRGPSSG